MGIDALTGLPNRDGFVERVEEAFESVSVDSPVTVMFADLDKFRLTNSRFGRTFGNRALKAVGETLASIASDAVVVAHTANNEYAFLYRIDKQRGYTRAEEIRIGLENTMISIDGYDVPITASFGIASTVEKCEIEDLFEPADSAMFAAKAMGRNCVMSASQLAESAVRANEDPVLFDFENRVRILTERLSQTLARRGRRLANYFQHEVDHDGLTGLYARKYFDHRIEREMENAKKSDRELSMAFLDIDHFGDVNKNHGFPTGDRALQHVAQVLSASIRSVDWVARYGGEEFCIVMPDTALPAAVTVAERIRTNICKDKVITFGGSEITLTACLGVGELTPADINAEAYVQRVSDKTRYAKRNGRDQVQS